MTRDPYLVRVLSDCDREPVARMVVVGPQDWQGVMNELLREYGTSQPLGIGYDMRVISARADEAGTTTWVIGFYEINPGRTFLW